MTDQKQSVPAHLEPVLGQIQALDWPEPVKLSENVDAVLDILKTATRPGKANDPARDDAHLLWVGMCNQLQEHPGLAVRFAQRWYEHLVVEDLARGDFSKSRGLAAFHAATAAMQRWNVASARRWLHVATIEDARHGCPCMAETVLLSQLDESKGGLVQLAQLARQVESHHATHLHRQTEHILTRWYLSQDIRRSDQSADVEHPANAEVLRLYVDDLTTQHPNAKVQGDALENLAAYLVSLISGCFPVTKSETKDFENDLVVRNLSRVVSPALDLLGRYFLVECKNWKNRVGSHEVAYFANRVRYGRATFGLLFAREGITGEGTDDADKIKEGEGAKFMLNRVFHQDGVVVAVVTRDDLERIQAGTETFLQVLLRKHDEVRFGAWRSAAFNAP